LNYTENALAHRGVLRGDDLWIGYNYVGNLYNLNALIDNYNFWIRKFTFDGSTSSMGGSWDKPKNVTNVTDKGINVREPRIFGTPASNINPGFCDGTATQDATFCQNRKVVYLMWGTQENSYPSDPEGGDDLGVFGTASFDGGATYATPVRISEEMGSMFDDDDSAFETQPQTRPDGTKFYAVFNTANVDGTSDARYVSGSSVMTLPNIELLLDSDDNAVPDLLVIFTYDPATDTISESSGTLAGFPKQGSKLDLSGTTVSYEGVVTDSLVYEFTSALVSDGSVTPVDSGGGGCAAANGSAPFDPVLWVLAALGLTGLGVRRLRRK
jgi:hypothetical protein